MLSIQTKDRLRQFVARFLPLFVVAGVCLLVGCGWLVLSAIDQHSASLSTTDAAPRPSSVVAQHDAPSVEDKKNEIRHVVRKFTIQYFSRSSELLSLPITERESVFKQKLEPFVTSGFLGNYVVPLDTPVDESLGAAGASLRVISVLFGAGLGDTGVEITVQQAVVLNGERTKSPRLVYDLTFVQESGSWRVDSITQQFE